MAATRNNRGHRPRERRDRGRRTAISSAPIEDALLLRGSRDFDDLAAYRAFIDELVGRRNARNRKRIDAERAVLRPLPDRRTDDYEEAIVTRHLLRRLHAAQGVLHRALAPDRPPAAGAPLRRSARGLHRRHASDDAAARPRLWRQTATTRSSTTATSSTRSRRKPMALLDLVYRDQLFPRDAYRRLFDPLMAAPAGEARPASSSSALLAIAHERGCEAELAALLDASLDAGDLPDIAALRARFAPGPRGAAAGHRHADPAQRLRRPDRRSRRGSAA